MASVPPTASLATQASWSRRADSSVWLPSRNSSASGVDPQRGEHLRAGDDGDDDVLGAGVGDGAPEARQGVDQPDGGVDQRRVVVLPAGLVLLGAAVVVDGDDLAAGLPGGGGQVQRRLAHPAADLEQRPGDGDGAGRLVQGAALVVGHEAGGGRGGGEEVGAHGYSLAHRANRARRAVIRRSVAAPAAVPAALAKNAPTAVVTGTARTSAIAPTRVRMTSSASAELVSATSHGWA